MTEMQNLVERLQDGFKDLKKRRREESKRELKEMGNIEVYELVETVRKTQCPICVKRSREGTIYCGCRKCLIPT